MENLESRLVSKPEIKKRIEGWHQILESGELVEMQERVLTDLEAKINEEEELQEEFKSFAEGHEPRDPALLTKTAKFAYPALDTRENRYLQNFINTTATLPVFVVMCASNSANLDAPSEELFRAFCFLQSKVRDILNKTQIILSPHIEEVYKETTDLGTPRQIMLDNVQTYFDIFRFVTQNAKTVASQKELLTRLLTERSSYIYKKEDGSEIDLNPQKETNIELLGRAPLRFWATARYDTPESIDGEPVIQRGEDEPLFSSSFIYLMTRDQVKMIPSGEDETESLLRHGGCPILHKNFKSDELMRRTGETYLRFYSLVANSD